MKKLIALVFVLLLSGCAGSKIRREYGAPEWEPAPKSAQEAERRANYEKDRVLSVENLCFEVKGKYYGSQGMQRYFSWAKANEAGSLLRQARHENAKSAIFPLISLGAFAGASTLGYQLYLANRPEGNYPYGETERNQSYVATLGGIGLGALLGIVIRNHYQQKSHVKRIEAAESFNRQLLQRLNFEVKPFPGGGGAALNSSF